MRFRICVVNGLVGLLNFVIFSGFVFGSCCFLIGLHCLLVDCFVQALCL